MAQRIAIIDYGSGNLRSVAKAVERTAREAGMAMDVSVTDAPDDIAGADRVILPGVGAFAACMEGLSAIDGVIGAMEHAVLVHGRPFLGVCVGMQLLGEYGLEFGSHRGLGWIPGKVVEIPSRNSGGEVEVPHMGWNVVSAASPGKLPRSIDGEAFYFAHSYHFEVENDAHAVATTRHGADLVAAVRRDNILGVQFHPEKSQSAGLALIEAFLRWAP